MIRCGADGAEEEKGMGGIITMRGRGKGEGARDMDVCQRTYMNDRRGYGRSVRGILSHVCVVCVALGIQKECTTHSD